jgi:hypothetical protein
LTLVAKTIILNLNQSVRWPHYQNATCRKLVAVSFSLPAFLSLLFGLSLFFELGLFLFLSFVHEILSIEYPMAARPLPSDIPNGSFNSAFLEKAKHFEHQ